MSIINEALKKAQSQRTGNPMDAAPIPGGGSGPRHGSKGMPTGTLVLLIAGAVVVIVISVVATVYFVNRPAAPKIAAAPVVAPAVVAVTTTNPAPAPAPVAVAAPAPPPAPTPVITLPSPVIIAPVIVKASPPPAETPAGPPPQVVEEPAPAAAATTAAAEPAVEGSLAERINTYVDKIRVTGIRTSEAGSKVLMNDHVYRVNDIVDRKLGLRLVKIATDTLTFSDASGATYVKNF